MPRANNTMKLWTIILFLTTLLTGLVGCGSVTSRVWTPYDKISMTASKNVNPDGNLRPSPIQVKVFELSSRTTFDNVDFEGLFYQGETLLSDELLSKATFTIQPKETLKHEILLNKQAKFVAILAAYRNIDSARWKHIYKVKPHGHYRHTITLGDNGIIAGKVVEEDEDGTQTTTQSSENSEDDTSDGESGAFTEFNDEAEEIVKDEAKNKALDAIKQKIR